METTSNSKVEAHYKRRRLNKYPVAERWVPTDFLELLTWLFMILTVPSNLQPEIRETLPKLPTGLEAAAAHLCCSGLCVPQHAEGEEEPVCGDQRGERLGQDGEHQLSPTSPDGTQSEGEPRQRGWADHTLRWPCTRGIVKEHREQEVNKVVKKHTNQVSVAYIINFYDIVRRSLIWLLSANVSKRSNNACCTNPLHEWWIELHYRFINKTVLQVIFFDFRGKNL